MVGSRVSSQLYDAMTEHSDMTAFSANCLADSSKSSVLNSLSKAPSGGGGASSVDGGAGLIGLVGLDQIPPLAVWDERLLRSQEMDILYDFEHCSGILLVSSLPRLRGGESSSRT